MHKLIVTFCVLALAGCHGSAKLSASPSSLADCGSSTHPSVVTVSWDAARATKGGAVKLWVRNHDALSGDKRRLWIESKSTGSATTGDWAMPNTQITLTDAIHGNKLAEISIGAAACKP